MVEAEADARIRRQMDVAAPWQEEGAAQQHPAADGQSCSHRCPREIRLGCSKPSQTDESPNNALPRNWPCAPQMAFRIQPHSWWGRGLQGGQRSGNRLVLPVGQGDPLKAQRELRGAAQAAGRSNLGYAAIQQTALRQRHAPIDIDGLDQLCPDSIAHVADFRVDSRKQLDRYFGLRRDSQDLLRESPHCG